MNEHIKKLLIRAENLTSIMLNNHANKELSQDFAAKLLCITKEISNEINSNNTY